MASIDIIVGTVTGTALQIAQSLATHLQHRGHECALNLEGTAPNPNHFWLICTANTGAGDLPNNIQPFYTFLRDQSGYLGTTRYALINLGDSCYPSFAQAGKRLDAALQDLGAQPICKMLVVDAIYCQTPTQTALEWLAQWENTL